MMSLFSDYNKERLGQETIERDWGFIAFHKNPPNVCFIDDIYVRPELRKQGYASDLADEVTIWAKANECNILACEVWPHARGSTESLKAILAYGFRLKSAEAGRIILSKEL